MRILVALLYSIKNHLRAQWCPAAGLSLSPDDDQTMQCEYSDLLPAGLKGFEEYGLGVPLELTFLIERYIQKGTERAWFDAPLSTQMHMQLNNLVDAFGRMETIRLTPLPIAHL